ncbi:hypothetical protein ED28_11250 [[Pantoea] beijingensis]|uniref:Uncharacterized protein n=1 Tax=[Pantoea] beijingensis TaxID=1324864 RepID=A0A443IDJ7_9GAMM|nr:MULTISPECIES: hypothetical protein [Erwiniaceae]RWR02199.1 hypothetical protein ED28_11250 [[Pantoea] beijingensis]
MKINRFLFISVLIMAVFAKAEDGTPPVFKDHKVAISSGPFIDKIYFTTDQQQNSKAWQNIMKIELRKNVNFAGHYRLYISKDGELPLDCGGEGWICGWIIDKSKGVVIAELPVFNGNSHYYSTIENGTPSPDPFSVEFYPNSDLIWINGDNIPKKKEGKISVEDKKCSNNAYIFKREQFILSFEGACEVG